MFSFKPNNESSVLCKCMLLDAHNPLRSEVRADTRQKGPTQKHERDVSGAYLPGGDDAEDKAGQERKQRREETITWLRRRSGNFNKTAEILQWVNPVNTPNPQHWWFIFSSLWYKKAPIAKVESWLKLSLLSQIILKNGTWGEYKINCLRVLNIGKK